MKVAVKHPDPAFTSYRAARVRSLFNAESGGFRLEAELPIEDFDWQVGLVVGPSGSGKTTIGKALSGPGGLTDLYADWPANRPLVDCIAPEGTFNAATAALAAVGLGDVPAWLRPFPVLSNGEQFRAGLARLLAAPPERAVIDEFTSVVDRQIAKVGSAALAKAWRRSGRGQLVLLTCHYDIIEWVQPDWIFDTANSRFARDCLRPRPRLELEIYRVNQSWWPLFKPHYYLDLPMPVAADCFVGFINGQPVAHLTVSPLFTASAYRATRLVVMPEWQGAGVGLRFLNAICQLHLDGGGRKGHHFPTFFHTSHPQLCGALRASPNWIQTGAQLWGANKRRCRESMERSWKNRGASPKTRIHAAGYGGHFRAIQAFKYVGQNQD